MIVFCFVGILFNFPTMYLQKKLNYAEEQLEIGNFGRVLNTAKILIEAVDSPFVKEGLLYKGMAYFHLRNYEAAVDFLSAAIEEDQDLTLAYVYRGEALIFLERFMEARKDALISCTLDPTNLEYRNNLIAVDQYLGDYQSIINTCNKVLKIFPNAFDFLLTRGDAYLLSRQFDLAIEDYHYLLHETVIEDFDIVHLYNNLGYAFSKKEVYQLAIDYFELALEIEEQHPYTLNNLGWALFQIGETEKALEAINLSIRYDPQNSYAFKNRAKIQIHLGWKENAKKDLLQAQALGYHIHYDDEVERLLEG